MCRDLMGGDIDNILIEFDPDGSLATTHRSQGSDMGLFGGFLGWEAQDARLPESDRYIKEAGINVEINIVDINADHPNTYKITLSNRTAKHQLTAISTGGGMIEVIDIDGAAVSMAGDQFVTLVYCDRPKRVVEIVETRCEFDEIAVHSGTRTFVEIKAQSFPSESIINDLINLDGVQLIRKLAPVLPVMTRKDMWVPFITCEEMLEYNEGKQLALWELAADYEAARGNISRETVFENMRAIVRIMAGAVDEGLCGTEYADRILGSQSLQFREKLENKRLVAGDVNNTIIMYVSAMMEVKSSMGVIVAAPTAGSCGALPGAILGTAHTMELSEDDAVKAMLASAMVGVFIAAHATFAAEVGGCMAETGAGAGMAAAGIVTLAGGSLSQSIGAASLALQNSLGLICDPIGNRVEAPCLGRNVMAATNAVSCANMALADYNHLIPLDEVIETMQHVGNQIHHTLRCTNLGGLSITRTAKQIEAGLEQGDQVVFKNC